MAAPDLQISRVFRREYGRAVAVLTGIFGNIDIAEDAVQDAFTAAVQRWPSAGIPPSPAGWIITTARNRAIDRLRREAAREDKHAQAALLQASRSGSEAAPAAEELFLDELAGKASTKATARVSGTTWPVRTYAGKPSGSAGCCVR